MAAPDGENTEVIRERVISAWNVSRQRQGKSNAALTTAEIDRFCTPDEAARALLHTALQRLNLSARSFHRVLKIARTIADLAGTAHIGSAHVAEAIQYRRGLG